MADVDLPELRRLAEAAHVSGRVGWGWDMARCVDQYQPDDQVRIYFDIPEVGYVAAVSPDVVIALLDRIDALEAGTMRLDFAPSLVDTIELALTECVREDGQGFKSTVAALQPAWPKPPVMSNLRTVATWVAMALGDQHKAETAP